MKIFLPTYDLLPYENNILAKLYSISKYNYCNFNDFLGRNRYILDLKGEKYALLPSIFNIAIGKSYYNYRVRASGTFIVHRTVSRVLGTSSNMEYHSKDRKYICSSGLLLDVTSNMKVVYAILIPRQRIGELIGEIMFSKLIGSASIDLPVGSKLYEAPNLDIVKGVYSTIRGPYKKMIRSQFDDNDIVQSNKILHESITPRVPSNMSISQIRKLSKNISNDLRKLKIE